MRVKTNTVNSGDAKAKAMPILSRAIKELMEGAETNAYGPGRTMKRHERGAPFGDEDIVPSFGENRSSRIKSRDTRFCYVSFYGELDVVLDRNQDSCYLGLDFNYLATPVLRPTRDWPIARTGDSDKRQILRESTYAVLNTKAHFMVDNVQDNVTPT